MVIVDKVSREFHKGQVQVLKNISFTISAGESVGIIGKNGVGKTTLLKLIVGMLSPTTGNVWTMGQDPCKTIDHLRPEMACLFSGTGLLMPADNVKSMLEKQKKVYRVCDKQYKEIMSEFDMEQYYERSFANLSTGQKRWVELAASVLPMPKILVLDEPTIGLDEENKERFCKMLKNLQNNYGMTIIISSHDLESLSASCNRILLLQDGRLSFDGSWARLKEKGNIWRKASFVSPDFIDMEDLPIKQIVYENNKMELMFKVSQITGERLKKYLEDRVDIKDFYVEEPPIEELVCGLLRGGDCA